MTVGTRVKQFDRPASDTVLKVHADPRIMRWAGYTGACDLPSEVSAGQFDLVKRKHGKSRGFFRAPRS